MRNIHKYTAALLLTVMILSLLLTGCSGRKDDGTVTITNVSYDPTREFYEKYNKIFESYYESEHGKKINVIQSHGGSGAQARSVVEGCNVDVVTLALEHDIDLIQNTGLIDKGWIDEFSYSSAPYTSTIVLLVRKGNPKHISDWDDLVKKNVDVITPDPKSSGIPEQPGQPGNSDGGDEDDSTDPTNPIPGGNGRYLVLYCSRTGSTERMAQQIQQTLDCDILEVEPQTPYESDYNGMLNRAQEELAAIRQGNYPAIKTSVEDFGNYDIVFVGYPIWYGSMGTPMQTFLHNHASKLAGKRIALFASSGSSGISASVDEVRTLCSGATFYTLH